MSCVIFRSPQAFSSPDTVIKTIDRAQLNPFLLAFAKLRQFKYCWWYCCHHHQRHSKSLNLLPRWVIVACNKNIYPFTGSRQNRDYVVAL